LQTVPNEQIIKQHKIMNTLKLGWTGLGNMEIHGDEPTQAGFEVSVSIVPKRKKTFTGCRSKISKQFTRTNGNL
jgi:hypothetical protein